MSNRTVPFGYEICNGKVIINKREKLIVQRIFSDYLDGLSLLSIAQNLACEKVEFLHGRFDWNKNRIKRIIEDRRYLGVDLYPAIISEEVYEKAQKVKNAHNNQGNVTNNFKLPCPTECAVCGGKMTRRHDIRKKVFERWICDNPDCKAVFEISDKDLFDELTALVNMLIANPDLIKLHEAESEPPIEIKRLSNKVSRQLDSLAFDKEQVRAAIFTLASEKYKHIDNTHYISKIMKAELEQMALLSAFSKELFNKIASKITLSADGVNLILKNQQIVGRE
ncbi:MAG: recombinase family protein [Oscillospiraceae bacterium]|nr:recombinase family protein [Oscillospiraceae bacterium]